jgi:electron transport complex protein RnfG
MEKLKSSLLNIFASLTGICLVAGIALSAANNYTESAIAASKAAELQNAIRKVTPEFNNNPTEEQYRMPVSTGDSLTVYPAVKDGKTVGYAVESYTKKGFSGLIRVMVGFDADGKIVNYSILEHSETPGLGSKMQEWFSSDNAQRSVLERTVPSGGLKVSKDGGEVDAITAATISSRAFLDAINTAYEACSGSDATSGATQKK